MAKIPKFILKQLRTHHFLVSFFWIAALIACRIYTFSHASLNISPVLAQQIGKQIWHNECGGKIEGLTSWNEREEFASLGIGHFIWYPEGKQGVFKQSFPSLLIHFKKNGVSLPGWLSDAKGCPWKTREEFHLSQNHEQMKELRELLGTHIEIQIIFMIERLQKALPTLLKHSPKEKHSQLNNQFQRLAKSPSGVYALLDYLNFKGEGIDSKESYQGHRWGLLQVLERMKGKENGSPAVEEFALLAKEILTERVQYAPVQRQEKRWLRGWYKRIDTYQNF